MQENSVRNRLLQASLELVHTQGFQALTQANAAAAAGVRQSHLTYYFPTRNELLKAVVQYGVATILDSLSDGSSPDPKALARLRRRVTERICNHGMARIMIGLTLASEEDPSLKQWLAQFQEDMQQRLGTLLRSYGLRPTQEEIVMLHVTAIGISMLSLGAGTEDAEAQAKRLILHAFDRLVEESRARGKPRATKSVA
jgi:AcrR family transcriptional regulator